MAPVRTGYMTTGVGGMRIGIDASCWVNRRGYGRFARELLTALVELDQDNEYYFLVDFNRNVLRAHAFFA